VYRLYMPRRPPHSPLFPYTTLFRSSHWMREMRAAAAEIKERTGGGVEIKFYPGGVMGNDAQVLRKIRIGQLHGGAFTAGGLAERSEEHTSELQSRENLVCRLLLEKK